MPGARLKTPQICAVVRHRFEKNESPELIAQEYGVSVTTIYRWANAAGWVSNPVIAAEKRAHRRRKREAEKRGSKPAIARTILEETHDPGLVMSRLGISQNTVYVWARSAGWKPDHEAAIRASSRKKIKKEVIPRYCLTCNERLVRKGRPSGKLESFKSFEERQHCDPDCAANDPDPEKRLERLLLAEIRVQSPRREKSPETKARQSFKQKKVMTERFASGEQIPAYFIYKSRMNGEPYYGFTDNDLVGILADRRAYSVIGQQFGISGVAVSAIKKGKIYKHVSRDDVFLRKAGNSHPVVTPKGQFDSVTMASKAYGVERHTGTRWVKQGLNGWRYANSASPIRP